MRFDYRIVNVFTRNGDRLTGNPLCVFENAAGLDAASMQALALQFNLSETSFLTSSEKADARVRIFAPTYEMPFAGHPTLGTAYVLRALRGGPDAVSLELNVGVVPVTVDGSLMELRANQPVHRPPAATKAAIAAALGLEAADLRSDPLWIDTGTEQLIVPLGSPDAVRRARASYDLLASATSDGKRPNAYVFAETGTGTLLARYFFSKSGAMIEDPATGSATANLGGFLLANRAALPLALTIDQGDMTGRPSTLRLRIDEEGNVFVAGEVIELGRGHIDV